MIGLPLKYLQINTALNVNVHGIVLEGDSIFSLNKEIYRIYFQYFGPELLNKLPENI